MSRLLINTLPCSDQQLLDLNHFQNGVQGWKYGWTLFKFRRVRTRRKRVFYIVIVYFIIFCFWYLWVFFRAGDCKCRDLYSAFGHLSAAMWHVRWKLEVLVHILRSGNNSSRGALWWFRGDSEHFSMNKGGGVWYFTLQVTWHLFGGASNNQKKK